MKTVLSQIRNRTLRLGMVQFAPNGLCYSYGVPPHLYPLQNDYVIVPVGMNKELKVARFSHFGTPDEYAALKDEINYKRICYIISQSVLDGCI